MSAPIGGGMPSERFLLSFESWLVFLLTGEVLVRFLVGGVTVLALGDRLFLGDRTLPEDHTLLEVLPSLVRRLVVADARGRLVGTVLGLITHGGTGRPCSAGESCW